MKIYSFSDSHLGSPYSRGAEYLPAIEAGMAEADIVVMGGDIFEGKATTETPAEVIQRAVRQMRRWLERFPETEIHWVQGNHEDIPGLLPAMQALAAEYPNFHAYADEVQLGEALFLHGDAPIHRYSTERRDDAPQDTSQLKLKLGGLISMTKHIHPDFPKLIGFIGNILAPGAASKALFHPPQKNLDAIWQAYSQEHPELLLGIAHIIYGHIHHAYQGFQPEGIHTPEQPVSAHNTGSAVIGRRQFKPLMIEMNEQGQVVDIQLRDPDQHVSILQRLRQDALILFKEAMLARATHMEYERAHRIMLEETSRARAG